MFAEGLFMKFITEKSHKTPITGQYTTVVAGGGIAGISAALAAARGGAKVLLIESQYILGGLATAGLITIYLPLCDGNGKQVTFGIAEELLRLSVKDGYEGKYCPAWLNGGSDDEKRQYRFEIQYNPYVFAIRAEQLLIDSGVEILYGSSVTDVKTKKGKITHVIIETPSGREAIGVKNVVDSTGDADICSLAGETTEIFKQGNVPASWYYNTVDGENKLVELGFSDIPDSQKTPEQLRAAKNSLRFTGLDVREITKFTAYSHSTLLEHFLKKGEYSTKHSLSAIALVPQIRMTRRISGIYTQDDSQMHTEFSDSVGLFSDWRKAGPVYELPFSTLYGEKIKNLITAGRCISVTDAMWDITRVIPVCAVSGEAAGTACALTDDFSKISIDNLQKILKSNNVKLHEKDL